MRDLVIGNSSQIAYYWPEALLSNTKFISSRDVNVDYVKSEKWNRIYFAFNDGATYLTDDIYRKRFINNNVDYPLYLIDQFHKCCKNIVFYSTTEVWNDYNGVLNLKEIMNNGIENSFEYKFWPRATPYVASKLLITTKLLVTFREKYPSVLVLFPYSFNSPMRKDNSFLFSKVFDSIIHKRKIIIGNTYFYRELLHPRFVVEQSLEANEHKIIGSGRLVFVNDFIRKLYDLFDLEYSDFVTEKFDKPGHQAVNRLDSKNCLYSYDLLLKDTCEDIDRELKRIKDEKHLYNS